MIEIWGKNEDIGTLAMHPKLWGWLYDPENKTGGIPDFAYNV